MKEPTATSVRKYLRAHDVPFVERNFGETFSSYDVARSTHLPGRGLARVTAVRDKKGAWLLAVVPAPARVDLEALAALSGHGGLQVAWTEAIAERFGGSALDQVPPFSELCAVPLYVDDGFAQASHIYFEVRVHHGVLGMRFRDYLRVAKPIVGHFALPETPGTQAVEES